MVMHPCFVVMVFTLLICSTGVWAGSTCKPRHICRHNQYTIVSKACTFSTCRDCPGCHIGMGLKEECGTAIIIGASIECIDCIDGSTFNDVDKQQIGSCKACDNQEHRKVISPCNKTHNTVYANDCVAGYYFLEGIMGPCRKCSCCNNDKKMGKKCLEVGAGVPANTSCTCPSNVNPSQQSSVSTTDTVRHDQPTPVTNRSSSTANNSETTGSSSSTTPFLYTMSTVIVKAKSVWMIPTMIGIAVVVVFLIIAVISVAVYCKNHATGGNGGMSDSEELVDALLSGEEAAGLTSHNGEETGTVLVASCEGQSVDTCRCAKPQDLIVVPGKFLSEMSHTLMDYLSLKLNPVKQCLANWYKVGEMFDVKKDVLDNLELEYRSGGSPTESLLSLLKTRGENEPTMRDLVCVLRHLGRHDIVDKWDWEADSEKQGQYTQHYRHCPSR